MSTSEGMVIREIRMHKSCPCAERDINPTRFDVKCSCYDCNLFHLCKKIDMIERAMTNPLNLLGTVR